MISKVNSNVYEVFRVEHNDRGIGPFQDSGVNMESIHYRYGKWWSNLKHPVPEADPMLQRSMEDGERIGCNSLTQLKHWFSRTELQKLYSFNFSVFLIIIPKEKLIKGKFQVMFNRLSVLSKKKLSYEDIYKN